jgi:Rrf2 family protein
MLSQTGLYALQALLYLAEQGKGAQVPAAVMARELDVPGTYLAKVLQRLAREGILVSTRGARGGYRLAVDPAVLTVAKAVASFQELRGTMTCLLGGPCDPALPCPAHERRSAWNAAALQILEQTTLADLLTGAPMGDLGSAGNNPSEKAS